MTNLLNQFGGCNCSKHTWEEQAYCEWLCLCKTQGTLLVMSVNAAEVEGENNGEMEAGLMKKYC